MEEGDEGNRASDAEFRRMAPGEEMDPGVNSPYVPMSNMINGEDNVAMVDAYEGHEGRVQARSLLASSR
jgi:hypothetical protein